MAFQHWYCESCAEEGTVQHKKGAGVWEVKEKITVQHRKYFPACDEMRGLEHVRLGFPNKAFYKRKAEPATS
jgi:hypothetical protein